MTLTSMNWMHMMTQRKGIGGEVLAAVSVVPVPELFARLGTVTFRTTLAAVAFLYAILPIWACRSMPDVMNMSIFIWKLTSRRWPESFSFSDAPQYIHMVHTAGCEGGADHMVSPADFSNSDEGPPDCFKRSFGFRTSSMYKKPDRSCNLQSWPHTFERNFLISSHPWNFYLYFCVWRSMLWRYPSNQAKSSVVNGQNELQMRVRKVLIQGVIRKVCHIPWLICYSGRLVTR